MSRKETKKIGKGDQENKHLNKESPLWSEETTSEILSHKELVHEDTDPIYPLDSVKDDRSKGSGKNEKKRKAS